MPPIMDEGLCIRQWDWSETSQTVSLLCRQLGLVRGLAKGSKRSTHPYSGGIELLTRGNVGVIPRPSSDLALITEWDLQETFPALRRSLAAHHVGLYIAELIQHAVHDHDPHPTLYDESLRALRSLGEEVDQHIILTRFQWALLFETGYKPELDQDVAAGDPLPDASWYFFDPRLGGLVGPHRAGSPSSSNADDPGASGASLWRIRRETVELLRALSARLESSQAQDEAHTRDATSEDRVAETSFARAAKFLAAYARFVFGREPRLMSVLFGTKLPR